MSTIFLEEIKEREVIDICKSLRSGVAASYDVSMTTVKQAIGIISIPNVINLSIKSGVAPDKLKIARVVPMYKSGEDNIFSTYRPVSVLTAFSKVLEKIRYNPSLSFLNKFNVLSNSQHIFRKNHSTEYALTHFYA